ncbi:MAG: Geranylgeranyl pyrophosphate synthase [Ignavibacteria bacterium]|nr:Geranylgeranyl pyrophosphate synthase [Ignavibacteria bacterium]
MENDYSIIYNRYLESIEKHLFDFIPNIEPQELYEPFRYIISGGGKRIRPCLMMISSGAVGTNPIDALEAACAIEVLHNFTLVHDDIMDKSPIRRGRQTVHIKWNESIGILTGDLMIGYVYRLLERYATHKNQREIFRLFNNALIEVCEGQALDMKLGVTSITTKQQYFNMIEKKTARLLQYSAAIGGLIGNGSESDVTALESFGKNIGMAFQLQDDLLDMTAEQIKFGKKIGQDIIEGKKTYLILHAAEVAVEESDMELINKFMKENGLPEEYVGRMQELLVRLGAMLKAEEIANDYFDAALSDLDKLSNNEHVETLRWLVQSLSKRNY